MAISESRRHAQTQGEAKSGKGLFRTRAVSEQRLAVWLHAPVEKHSNSDIVT